MQQESNLLKCMLLGMQQQSGQRLHQASGQRLHQASGLRPETASVVCFISFQLDHFIPAGSFHSSWIISFQLDHFVPAGSFHSSWIISSLHFPGISASPFSHLTFHSSLFPLLNCMLFLLIQSGRMCINYLPGRANQLLPNSEGH